MNKKQIIGVVRHLAKLIAHMDVIDYDKIPQEDNFLLTTNHTSRLDSPFLMLSTPRDDFVAVVTRKYRKKIFFKWFLEKVGVIWMNREETDFSALREAINYLRKGWIVGIAPEGTRSGEQKLMQGKAGAAVLAERANVLIVPVSITGPADMVSDLLHFKKAKIVVRFGEPYRLPKIDMNDRKNWLIRSTDEIMCRIAALLPESYRGYYADHPRLKELLAEK